MKRALVFVSVLAVSAACAPIARAFDGGDGSPGDPYQISTCAQLQEVGYPENLASSFVLTQDVDCTGFNQFVFEADFSSGFSPIGSLSTAFSGTFDGGGYAIQGLYMLNYGSYSGATAGLFARTSGAEIFDLILEDAEVHVYSNVISGLLVGQAVNTEISSVYVSGIHEDDAPASFHISRVEDGVLNEVYVSGYPVVYETREFSFSGISAGLTLEIVQEGAASFAGIDAVALRACGKTVPLASARYVSSGADVREDVAVVDRDVVGAHEKAVRVSWDLPQACNDGVVSLTANEYGHGGYLQYPRSGSVSYRLGSRYAGPLFTAQWTPSTGHPSGDVPVTVSDDGQYLYVSADVVIDNTDDNGEDWISVVANGREFMVSDADDTYGSCSFGRTERVPYKHNSCALRIPRGEIPGGGEVSLVLRYYGTAGTTYRGGLAGMLESTSSVAESSAFVDQTNSNSSGGHLMGGMAGLLSSNSEISDSYARGTLTADAGGVAGLVYESDGVITNSYAAVQFAGTPGATGGLTGFGTGVTNTSFWDTEYSGAATSTTGTGKTTAEMKTFGTYAGWDFDNIWDIGPSVNDGYPYFGSDPAPTPTPTPSPSGGSSTGGVAYGSPLWYQLGYSASPTPTPAPSPSPAPALTEGDMMRAEGDEDVFIVNAHGFKRLFLNEVIFGFYAHLGWDKIKTVTAAVRDSYGTSGLFRNCEAGDLKVYALEVTGDDTGVLHWVDVSGPDAVAQDPNFFNKVFCINANEFNWYPKSSTPYTKLSDLPTYE